MTILIGLVLGVALITAWVTACILDKSAAVAEAETVDKSYELGQYSYVCGMLGINTGADGPDDTLIEAVSKLLEELGR